MPPKNSYDEIFKEIANGNREAYEFCRTFFEWVHVVDDLWDRDRPVTADLWIHASLKLLDMAARNEFFRKNCECLLTIIRTSALAWVASEELKKRDSVQDRVVAEVLKSEYQNVFFAVAFLVGGFSFQKEMDAKHRGYAFN